jgi:hypothetical protein
VATGGGQREASRACVAANPTKYGQACVLSSCEALAAALYIAGFPHDAHLVMEKFKWGDSFFQLNGEYLDAYAACGGAAEVIATQRRLIETIEAEREASALAKRGADREYGGNWGMPSSSSSSDEGEGEDAEGIGGDLGVGDGGGDHAAEDVAWRLAFEQQQQEPQQEPQRSEAEAGEEEPVSDVGQSDEPPPNAEISGGVEGEAESSRCRRVCQLQRQSRAGAAEAGQISDDDGGDETFRAWRAEWGSMLVPGRLWGGGGGGGGSTCYPAPAAAPRTYTAAAAGRLRDVEVKTCRPGLLFDDSWMDEECGPEMGRVREIVNF